MATNSVKNKKIEKKSMIVKARVRLAPGIAAATALYSVSADAVDIPIPTVPEPGTFSLLAAGVAGVACAKLLARRRKK